ncbi:hypothetical protein M431DRAFT_528311 [Trichoderma harzianum CBS 226.95]|uniref:Uncharacterized protein n=1 Tax=Trichoderma harzianum CBS 226.95 TaxID=983964 RepID=A0A2T4AJT6_TRIHA|nr:hypothetical protein M431DRAFT_528311 [Trichoderma harzianum CBS 226.95]PTB57331.1 hypothetical protein M431DRAFT_528311 [Trichoderma harzianum CBS 226.95]
MPFGDVRQWASFAATGSRSPAAPDFQLWHTNTNYDYSTTSIFQRRSFARKRINGALYTDRKSVTVCHHTRRPPQRLAGGSINLGVVWLAHRPNAVRLGGAGGFFAFTCPIRCVLVLLLSHGRGFVRLEGVRDMGGGCGLDFVAEREHGKCNERWWLDRYEGGQ